MTITRDLLQKVAGEHWMLPRAERLWGLAVFPLYPRPSWHAGAAPPLRYTPLPEALEQALAQVVETPESSVVLHNPGHQTVLGLDGDRLGSGRILDTSVLLGHGDTRLPASYVERGRWQQGAGQLFTSLLQQGYRADQRSLWRDLEPQGAPPEGPGRATLQAYVEALPYPKHALGLAVAVGGQLRGLDLFDQPSTCRYYWSQLVRTGAAQALTAAHESPPARDLLAELTSCEGTGRETPGLGQELMLQGPTVAGKALVYQGVVVHLSLYPRGV